ncbi:MAG: 30S ribosomal protein S6 [bacterium]
MENYEVMFLMDVNMPEDERRDIANEIERDIIDLGGEVTSSQQYDVRNLAFPIDNVKRAEYRLIEYEAEKSGTTNDELRERLNFNEDIVRYLIVNQNKDRPPQEEVFEEEEEEEVPVDEKDEPTETDETETTTETESEDAEPTEA